MYLCSWPNKIFKNPNKKPQWEILLCPNKSSSLPPNSQPPSPWGNNCAKSAARANYIPCHFCFAHDPLLLLLLLLLWRYLLWIQFLVPTSRKAVRLGWIGGRKHWSTVQRCRNPCKHKTYHLSDDLRPSWWSFRLSTIQIDSTSILLHWKADQWNTSR